MLAEAAANRAIAKESLEHAIERKDLTVLTAAIEEYKVAAADTDVLWRATTLRKQMIAAEKAERKQVLAAAAAPPLAAQPTLADAIEALERAMAAEDLKELKAAIAEHEELAEDTDALYEAQVMAKRLTEERKAEKKKRLKETGGGSKAAGAGAPPAVASSAVAPPAAQSSAEVPIVAPIDLSGAAEVAASKAEEAVRDSEADSKLSRLMHALDSSLEDPAFAVAAVTAAAEAEIVEKRAAVAAAAAAYADEVKSNAEMASALATASTVMEANPPAGLGNAVVPPGIPLPPKLPPGLPPGLPPAIGAPAPVPPPGLAGASGGKGSSGRAAADRGKGGTGAASIGGTENGSGGKGSARSRAGRGGGSVRLGSSAPPGIDHGKGGGVGSYGPKTAATPTVQAKRDWGTLREA